METGVELILFTAPQIGHLLAEIEVGRQLVALDPEITLAILIPKPPIPNEKLDASIQSLDADLKRDDGAHQRISLVELPPLDEFPQEFIAAGNPVIILDALYTRYKSIVKHTVENRRRRKKIVGLMLDMFCTTMLEVAEELNLPSYLFYTSGANLLSMMLTLETIEGDIPSLFGCMSPDSTPVNFPGFKNPVPLKVWPDLYLNKALLLADLFRRLSADYRKTKGILVNTFQELESDLYKGSNPLSHQKKRIKSFVETERVPPVYSMGPIVHHPNKSDERTRDPILSWLDEQPDESVVFFCFGSMVTRLEKAQVEQLAIGIEKSGQRFLWALRDSSEVLPEGFVERTEGVGKVIGWAPQTGILEHKAVGVFVSHCGWNSTLESIWFGVPMVTWPLYAEQQLNAFFMVKEVGLAVELRMDYQFNYWEVKANMVIDAAEIEAAIRRAMEQDEGAAVRKKLKEMSELSRKAMNPGGSSYGSLVRFLENVRENAALMK